MQEKSTYCNKHFLSLILFFLIAVFYSGSVFSQENSVTDSLNRLLRQSRIKTDILTSLAAEYQYISPVKSLQVSCEALVTARKEKNPTGEAYACYYIASNYLSLGQYDTCLKMLDRSEMIFSRLNNTEGLLHTVNARANLKYLQGKFDDALEQFEDNLQKSEKGNLTRIQVSALLNIGRINWLRGKPETALRYYSDAL